MSMLEKNTCDFSSSRFEFAGQRQKEDMFYSLNWIVSPGLRSQFKIHDVPIVFHLDTQKYHILFFDISKFDVTTIIERKCMKDQKQKAEFNLYIYIYSWFLDWWWWWYINIENWLEFFRKRTNSSFACHRSR